MKFENADMKGQGVRLETSLRTRATFTFLAQRVCLLMKISPPQPSHRRLYIETINIYMPPLGWLSPNRMLALWPVFIQPP